MIDVGHLRNVHCRIAHVDAIHVSLAYVIRRHIHFPRAKREPSHVAAEASGASTDEDHQSGRIHGVHRRRTGDPAPASADTHPASVVKRGITPWRVIDPCVSPRRNPCPMAGVVRSPTSFHPVRKPDVAIGAIVAPVAVVVEILVANHIVRQILC